MPKVELLDEKIKIFIKDPMHIVALLFKNF